MEETLNPAVASQPLRRVLLRRVAVVIGLQLLLTVFLVKFQLFPQVESLQIELNTNLADTVGHTVQRALDFPVTAVQAALRQWDASGSARPANLKAMLQQMVDTNDAADTAYVLSSDGRVISLAYALKRNSAGQRDDESDRLGLDMSRSAVFHPGVDGVVTISSIFLSPITDQPTIAVSGRHASGIVIVMEISLSKLAQSYNVAKIGNGLQVIIVDKSGQIIADKDGAKSLQSGMLPIEATRSLEKDSVSRISMDDQSWLATSYLVKKGGLDWRVVVMRPLAQVYQPILLIVALTLAGTVAVSFATFIVLVVSVRKVARETEQVSANALSLQRGVIPSPLHLSVRELSDMDASLRDMASALLQREQLLRQSNEELEARVVDRTQHLEKTNGALATTLKKLETTQAELVHAGKMSALGGMVAGVSHELNTPVGNARLAATTLSHTAETVLSMLSSGKISRTRLMGEVQDIHSGAALIDRSLERASEIVRAFKQIAVDQASHRRREFLLADVIHENEVLLTPRLKKTGVKVLIRAPGEIRLNSYPGDLGQVLTNLIENAMVHAYQDTPEGTVEISAEPLGDSDVRITIKDHGKGIAPEAMGRVFDPFYTTRLGQGGSGLGLSIVYNIVVSSLGGKISVSSELGKGSCFTVDLPLVAPQGKSENTGATLPD